MGGQIRSKWHNAMQERWNRTDDPERPYLVPFAESVELDAVAETIRSSVEVAGQEGFQLGQSLIRPMGVVDAVQLLRLPPRIPPGGAGRRLPAAQFRPALDRAPAHLRIALVLRLLGLPVSAASARLGRHQLSRRLVHREVTVAASRSPPSSPSISACSATTNISASSRASLPMRCPGSRGT